MRNQGEFKPYPKIIVPMVTVEGIRVAKVISTGFWGSAMGLQEETWKEIGRVMGWK